MSISSALLDDVEEQDKVYGVVVAVVTTTKDPEGLGRVKVKYPWLGKDAEGYWARMASPMAGPDRGVYFLPEVDDMVLVAFEQGDVRFGYVIGSLWSAKHKPPVKNEDGKNDIRLFKSRSGHTITLDDTDGAERITVIDKSGKNSISIDSKNHTIKIESGSDIVISAAGTFKVEAKEISIKSSTAVTLESGDRIRVTAPTVNINNGALEIT